MNYESGFKGALFISLLVHSFILLSLPKIASRDINASLKKLEVTYYKLQLLSDALQVKLRDVPPQMSKNYKDNISAFEKNLLPEPAILKDNIKEALRGMDAQQKKPLTVRQFMSKKQINLPLVKSEKMKNPVYNNYYQAVREKIRHRAYYNYSRYDTGEVYLTFVISSDGSLKEVKLIEAKSRASNYLKDIALRSIHDASPFPAFPSNLQFPELSFNVVISFEVNN